MEIDSIFNFRIRIYFHFQNHFPLVHVSVSACPQNPREKKEEWLALSRIKLLKSIKRCGNACPHATTKAGTEGGQGRQARRHSQRGEDRQRETQQQQQHTQHTMMHTHNNNNTMMHTQHTTLHQARQDTRVEVWLMQCSVLCSRVLRDRHGEVVVQARGRGESRQ